MSNDNSGSHRKNEPGAGGNAKTGKAATTGKAGRTRGGKSGAKRAGTATRVSAHGDGGGRGPLPVWGKILVTLLVVVVAVPLMLFGVAYVRADIPEPGELTNPQIATIYAADGETQLARLVPPEGNRRQVSLDKVPQHLREAVLAAEDREFYTNPGFSLSGYARAAWGMLTGNESAGGGSTITQQYVKNALVGNERTISRKLRELVASAKMTNQWSKDEILEAYLNTIYFGRNAYGVAAAADAYFGKDLSQLTPEESAVIAAAIQRPSQLDPWVNREEAEQRWNYVLDGMVQTGAITQAQRVSARYPETIDPANNRAFTEATGANGLLKNRVVEELATVGISEEDVETLGLKVTTTIDAQAQQDTEEIVKENLAPQVEKMRSAVVSIDPRNGEIKAYYGGEDPNGWDYANAPVQTGSTFKIFGLAAALQQGIPLNRMYSSDPVQTGDATVTNSDGMTCGTCTIQQATKMSLNTSFIRLQKDLKNGPVDTQHMAWALGVRKNNPDGSQTLSEANGEPYEGIILGQYPSRPMDMAVGLSTLTNNGVWHQPHFVRKVTTGSGEVLYEYKPNEGERRVDKNTANGVTAAMLPIAAWSNGNVLGGGNRPSASKTGTTQYGEWGTKDAWMIGSTPQLATAVWVGNSDNSLLVNSWGGSVYGAGIPATIWRQVMDAQLANEPVEEFDLPIGLGYNAAGYGVGYGTSYPTATGSTATSSAPSASQAPGEGAGTGAPAQSPAGEAPAPAPQAPAPAPLPVPEVPQLPDLGNLIPPAA